MDKLYRDSAQLFGRSLQVLAFRAGEDWHVSIFGGDRAHIGAVSILSPDGAVQTLSLPGHRDDAVSSVWAEALREAGVKTAVIEVGIHYDNLSKDGITAVLENCDTLLGGFLRTLH